MRACSTCGIDQDESQFRRRKRGGELRHTQCRSCHNEKSKDINRARYASDAEFRRTSAASTRRAAYLRRYGITPDEVAVRLAAQGGVCACCGDTPAGLGHVDHDHATGAIRGVLCARCNIGIGYFLDRPERLRAAAAYLMRDSGEPVVDVSVEV